MAFEEIIRSRKSTYGGFVRLLIVSIVLIIMILGLMALFLV